MAETPLTPPAGGERITRTAEGLNVPDQPIIPFIEGDGTGPDIWRASVRVFDAAVQKAYGKKRRIHWFEVPAGEKSFEASSDWLPEQTIEALREHIVSIKGPLGSAPSGGLRSLSVALRQALDLFINLRPVRWFEGVPSPIKNPAEVDVVIFRENIEDSYSGVEFAPGSSDAQKLLDFLASEFPKAFAKLRFASHDQIAEWNRTLEASGSAPVDAEVQVGLGLKAVSYQGTARLVRSAIAYAIANGRKSVTLVHKGAIMKSTEGAFRDFGYQVAREVFGAVLLDDGPWHIIPEGKPGAGLVIRDAATDAFLQQMLLRPAEYDVIATLNQTGDYLGDALAAQIGGIGIAPGANINDATGIAIFEATHGTAPQYADRDLVNPGSVILSGEMLLRYIGWTEAADALVNAIDKTIRSKKVTYDFARQMDGATEVKCSKFADEIIKHL